MTPKTTNRRVIKTAAATEVRISVSFEMGVQSTLPSVPCYIFNINSFTEFGFKIFKFNFINTDWVDAVASVITSVDVFSPMKAMGTGIIFKIKFNFKHEILNLLYMIKMCFRQSL